MSYRGLRLTNRHGYKMFLWLNSVKKKYTTSLLYSWDEGWKEDILRQNKKNCWWQDSNTDPLVLEASTLPTVPEPQPKNLSISIDRGFARTKLRCPRKCRIIISNCKTSSICWCYKTFLEEIKISPKLRNWLKFVLISEPAQKCENNCAIFKQNFTQ